MKQTNTLTYSNDTNETSNMIAKKPDWNSLAITFQNTKSPEDFKKLFEATYRPMLKYVGKMVKTLSSMDGVYRFISAKDIVITTLQLVHSKIENYNPEWNFSTWIYTIAKNITNLYIRKARKEKAKRNKSSVGLHLDPTYNINEDLVDSSYQEQTIKTTYNKVLDKIGDLPDIFKDIITDRDVEGMSYQMIADKYKLPINTVKSRIRTGRERLRTMVFQDKTINHDDIREILS